MLMLFDYFLFALPAFLLSSWAQARILRAYAAGSRVPVSSGLTGAEAAALVMRQAGVAGVAIEAVAGELSDHYDPRTRVLRLSHGVYAGRSLAAVGIAAHEAGHAAQDAAGYPALIVRNLIVPIASMGSQGFWLLMAAGLLLNMPRLIIAGLWLYLTVLVFQIVNLPVEYDASRRGRRLLREAGVTIETEDAVVAQVLNAAAWTYVAAALTSVFTLLYYLSRLGLLGRRRNAG